MDTFEKYFIKNKGAFEFPPEGQDRVWSELEKKLTGKTEKPSSTMLYRYLGGILMVLCVIAATLIYTCFQNDIEDKEARIYATLQARYPNLGIMEAQMNSGSQYKALEVNLSSTENRDIQFLFNEIRSIDSIHKQTIEMLDQFALDERTAYILLDYNQRKINILEEIIKLQIKNSKYETDNESYNF